MSADLIAAGLQVGWIALRRATMPDTWGQDMDVPDSILKSSENSSFSITTGDAAGDQEAKMLTPGAAMSGCTNVQKNLDHKDHKNCNFL